MMSESGFKWRSRLWTWAPLFVWIALIFFLSNSSGSLDSTSRFIGPLLAFFFPDLDPGTRAVYHVLIRKAAHFTAYGVLAMLAWRTFRTILPAISRLLVLTLSLVATVAIADELNQSFNSARSGSVWDVLLDLAGGLTATLVLYLVAWRRGAYNREASRP